MVRKGIPRNIVISDQSQLERWEKHTEECFSNFSAMIRHYVDKGINEAGRKDTYIEAIEPLKNSIGGLFKQNEVFAGQLELILMKITKDGIGSDVTKAMVDCLRFLIHHPDQNRSEISSKFNYSQETIDKALSFLIEMELIGHRQTKPVKKEKGGKHEKKDTEK